MSTRFVIAFVSALAIHSFTHALETEMITTSTSSSPSSAITPDKGVLTKYVSSSSPEGIDTPLARRGKKVFESNAQNFKWGRPTAALALGLMVLGLLLLVRFMRRKTLRAKLKKRTLHSQVFQ